MPQPGARRIRRRLAAALIALGAAAALSACAQPPEDVAPPPLPEGVTVALVQWRSDVAARQAQVEVHNGTAEPIEIGDVAVTDPRLADVATRVIDKVSMVPAGGTVDIRIQLPEVSCAVFEGASTVQLTFLERGFDDRREAPLPDKLGFLAPLHERECRAQALAAVAAVTLTSFEPSPPGAAADLVMEIVPTGDAAARIAAVQSTNLLTFGDLAPRRFPIDVAITAENTAPTTVHLPLVPQRCDPHVVQEDKRGTVFNIEVELDDGEPGLVQVAASEAMRARILNWVADWCGFGEG